MVHRVEEKKLFRNPGIGALYYLVAGKRDVGKLLAALGAYGRQIGRSASERCNTGAKGKGWALNDWHSALHFIDGSS